MARIKDLKEKNQELNVNLIDILKNYDVSDTNKYLPFLISIFKELEFINEVERLIFELIDSSFQGSLKPSIELFEKYQNTKHVENKDINTYSLDTFLALTGKLENIISESDIKNEQTIEIVDNDKINIVIPLTQPAIDIYCSGTKWCLVSGEYTAFTAGGHEYWNKHFYFIVNIKRDIHKVDKFNCISNENTMDFHKLDDKSKSRIAIQVTPSSNNVEVWFGNDKKYSDSQAKNARIFNDLLLNEFITAEECRLMNEYIDKNLTAKELSQQRNISANVATKSRKNVIETPF